MDRSPEILPLYREFWIALSRDVRNLQMETRSRCPDAKSWDMVQQYKGTIDALDRVLTLMAEYEDNRGVDPRGE